MAYGQKNYNEIQGINGKYTIHSIGCFLTAFANLRSRFGGEIDPLALNAAFRDRGIYIDVDDGVRDDLGWGSISQFDPNIIVTKAVNKAVSDRTAGWPTSNNAIVRFYYKSVNTGQMITHFCLVADAAAHTIVDSWDGLVKASPYGEPSGWAEYELHTPVAVTPPAPAPAPEVDYINVTVQAGWGITHVLAAAGYTPSQYGNEAEWDRIAALNGSPTRLRLKPGEVVKVYKQPLPAPEQPSQVSQTETPTPPQTTDNGAETIPVKVVPFDFRSTYQPKTEEMQATADAVIEDLDGKLPPLDLAKGQRVNSVGTFEKAGVKYYRLAKWVAEDSGYGIPESVLEPYDDPSLFNIDISLKNEAQQAFRNLSARRQVVAAFGSLMGLFEKLGLMLRINKKAKQGEN